MQFCVFSSLVSQEDRGKKTQTDNRTACWEVKQQECFFKPDALVLLLTKTIKMLLVIETKLKQNI